MAAALCACSGDKAGADLAVPSSDGGGGDLAPGAAVDGIIRATPGRFRRGAATTVLLEAVPPANIAASGARFTWLVTPGDAEVVGGGVDQRALSLRVSGQRDLPVGLRVVGSDGATATWSTIVRANDAPLAVLRASGTPVVNQDVGLSAAASSDREGDDLRFAWRVVTAPTGSTPVLRGEDTATPTLRGDRPGSYQLEVVVSDPLGAGAPARGTVVLLPSSRSAPTLTLTATPAAVAVGAEVLLALTAKGDAPAATTQLTVNGQAVALSNGQARFTPKDPGAYAVVADVTDTNGNQARASARFFASSAAKDGPPTVQLTAPADGARVTGGVTVTGTVTDSDLAEYVVEVAPLGSDRFLTIGRGTQPVSGGALATLDPSLFPGDATYLLRLRASDSYGQEQSVTQSFALSGTAPVGANRLSLRDLALDFLGIPLAIDRRYDSFFRASGDFGQGWSLAIDTGRLEIPSGLSKDWVSAGGCGFFSPPVTFDEQRAHVITVRIGARLLRARMTLKNPQCFFGLSLPRQATVAWVLDAPSYNATLAVDGEGEAVTDDGGVLRRGEMPNLGAPYEPAFLTVTLATGRAYRFEQGKGLVSIREADGAVTTFSPTAITASTGAGITMTRDGAGRITALRRPDGKQRTYEYNNAGDLTATVDFSGQRVSYVYGPDHLLLAILNSEGKLEAGFSYDDQGRLLAQTGASGGRRTVTTDAATRTQTITDETGVTAQVVFNDRGLATLMRNGAGDVHRFEYDAAGNRTAWVDARGNRTVWSYDAQQRPTQVQLPSGRVEVYGYDATTGALVSRDDGLGHSETLSYDRAGRVTAHRNLVGGDLGYAYDAAGGLTKVTLPDGAATVLTRDAAGFLTGYTDYGGVAHGATHDEAGRPTSDTVMLGGQPFTVNLGYDAEGTLVSLSEGGRAVTRVMDGEGRAAAISDAQGNRSQALYGDDGRTRALLRSDGSIVEYGYDGAGRLRSLTEAGTRKTTYSYDAAGRLASVALPFGTTVQHSYEAGGALRSTTDGQGRTVSFTNDALGRPTTVTLPTGATMKYQYDAAGRTTAYESPTGVRTTRVLDAYGRPTELRSGPTVVQMTYDGVGKLTALRDGNGGTSALRYDGDGNLTGLTDAEGRTVSYGYDATGLASATDANGKVQRVTHDGAGNVLSHTLASGATARTTIDGDARTHTHVGFDGKRTIAAFDARGARASLVAEDGTTVRFRHNERGERLSNEDARGVTAFTRDDRGLLTGVLEPDGRAVQYGYDAEGRLLSVRTPGGALAYTRSPYGDLTSVTDGGRRYEYSYDAARRPTAIRYPNGVSEALTYNDRGLLAARTVTSGASQVFGESYGYDAGGRLISIDALDGSRTVYGYDKTDRLIAETFTPMGGAARARSYGYDGAGNLSSISDENGARTLSYDADNRLVSDGVATYSHDGAGNLIEVVGGPRAARYRYDGLGRLVHVDTSGAALGVHAIDYRYDAEDLMVARVVDGVERRFLWDRRPGLVPQLLEESDASGRVTARYVLGQRLLARESDGQVSYLHRDRLGSVRLQSDGAGAVTARLRYTAYGELAEGALGDAQPFGFGGERFDPQAGTYYLRARHYAPSLQRFLSRDGEPPDPRRPLTLNAYLYGHDCPTHFTDPSGRLAMLEYLGVTAPTLPGFIHLAGQVSAIVLYGFDVTRAGGLERRGGIFDIAGPPDAALFGLMVQIQPFVQTFSAAAGFEILGGLPVNGHGSYSAAYLFTGYTVSGVLNLFTFNYYAGFAWDVPTAASYTGAFHSFSAPEIFFWAAAATFAAMNGVNGAPFLAQDAGYSLTHFYSPHPGTAEVTTVDGRVEERSIWSHGFAAGKSFGFGGDHWKQILAPSNRFTFAFTNYGNPCPPTGVFTGGCGPLPFPPPPELAGP